jgi:hypothetical protein
MGPSMSVRVFHVFHHINNYQDCIVLTITLDNIVEFDTTVAFCYYLGCPSDLIDRDVA